MRDPAHHNFPVWLPRSLAPVRSLLLIRSVLQIVHLFKLSNRLETYLGLKKGSAVHSLTLLASKKSLELSDTKLTSHWVSLQLGFL